MKVTSGRSKQEHESQVGFSIARFYHEKRQMMMVKIKPGEVYVSSNNELISTNLGSCVAACIWDPERRIGGMNHLMLAHCQEETKHGYTDAEPSNARGGKYGDIAMAMLIEELLLRGAAKNRLRVKLFGGGQVMGQFSTIGHENIVFALQYVQEAGLSLVGSDLGDHVTRQLLFEPTSGRAWVRRFPALLYQSMGKESKPGIARRPLSAVGRQDKEISAC